MSEEKPLHVRVAEALGWVKATDAYDQRWAARPPAWLEATLPRPRFNGPGGVTFVPRYDTDWSVTGPWIERLGISIYYDPAHHEWGASCIKWHAHDPHAGTDSRCHQNPLVAACHLILALSGAGKLEDVQ